MPAVCPGTDLAGGGGGKEQGLSAKGQVKAGGR